jgi:hypothetical protein
MMVTLSTTTSALFVMDSSIIYFGPVVV